MSRNTQRIKACLRGSEHPQPFSHRPARGHMFRRTSQVPRDLGKGHGEVPQSFPKHPWFWSTPQRPRIPHKAFLDFPPGTWALRRGDVERNSRARHQPPQGRSWALTPGHSPRGMASGGRTEPGFAVSSHFRKIGRPLRKSMGACVLLSNAFPSLGTPTTTHARTRARTHAGMQ